MNQPEARHLRRREFLKRTLAAASAAALHRTTDVQADAESATSLIDVNVHLSRWPTRRLPDDDVDILIARLRQSGVTEAWAGSFDAVLHKDLRAVNTRVARQCRRHGNGLLVAIGTVNPASPGWEEDLERCADEHRMPAIRLFPNYHGYELAHPEFARLLRLAAARGIVVQLAVVMEDERMMHPLLRVEPVDTSPLAALVREAPGLRLVLLNALRTLRDPALAELFEAGEVYAEISMLEGVGGLDKLLARAPSDRLLFGSHAPFFYIESALLKLGESALTHHQMRAISRENARRLLANA